MVALPAETPVTAPLAVTVATAVLLLLHTPPLTASEKLAVPPPAHMVNGPPVIVPGTGSGLTVTGTFATAVPQLFVTE